LSLVLKRPPGLDLAPEHSAEIADLSHDGRGVARIDGKVWFVADALPGERVRFLRTRGGRDADEAQALVIERPSPERVEPACAHFGVCGGCALQHMATPAQVQFKQKQLIEALERIGRVRADTIAEAVTGPALVSLIGPYAESGDAYAAQVRAVMNSAGLTRFDASREAGFTEES